MDTEKIIHSIKVQDELIGLMIGLGVTAGLIHYRLYDPSGKIPMSDSDRGNAAATDGGESH